MFLAPFYKAIVVRNPVFVAAIDEVREALPRRFPPQRRDHGLERHHQREFCALHQHVRIDYEDARSRAERGHWARLSGRGVLDGGAVQNRGAREPQTTETANTAAPLHGETYTQSTFGIFSPDIREFCFPDLDTQVPSKRQFCSNMIYP